MAVARDEAALALLEAGLDGPERSRSSYWERERNEFTIDAAGRFEGATVLGMVSRKRGLAHTLAHRILQTPHIWMGRRFPANGECQRLARVIAARQGRQTTLDFVRQALALAFIRAHVSLDRTDEASLVIGDGFGVMTALLLLALPKRRVVLANLTKPLLLDLVNVRKSVPGVSLALVSSAAEMDEALARADLRLIAVRADDSGLIQRAPIGLAVSMASMQEMNPPVFAEYFRILRTNPAERTAFYCANRMWKKLYDGTEVRFDDYPWRAGDEMLYDGPVPWEELHYDKKPPFWFHRPGGQKAMRLRLAFLEKDRGDDP
jgi:hypothetical protein